MPRRGGKERKDRNIFWHGSDGPDTRNDTVNPWVRQSCLYGIDGESIGLAVSIRETCLCVNARRPVRAKNSIVWDIFIDFLKIKR